jgi:hypothetical protein
MMWESVLKNTLLNVEVYTLNCALKILTKLLTNAMNNKNKLNYITDRGTKKRSIEEYYSTSAPFVQICLVYSSILG